MARRHGWELPAHTFQVHCYSLFNVSFEMWFLLRAFGSKLWELLLLSQSCSHLKSQWVRRTCVYFVSVFNFVLSWFIKCTFSCFYYLLVLAFLCWLDFGSCFVFPCVLFPPSFVFLRSLFNNYDEPRNFLSWRSSSFLLNWWQIYLESASYLLKRRVNRIVFIDEVYLAEHNIQFSSIFTWSEPTLTKPKLFCFLKFHFLIEKPSLFVDEANLEFLHVDHVWAVSN